MENKRFNIVSLFKKKTNFDYLYQQKDISLCVYPNETSYIFNICLYIIIITLCVYVCACVCACCCL